MEEINFKVDNLDSAIEELKKLKSNCQNIEIITESVSGSGKPIDILIEIESKYKEIQMSMELLIDNSIAFFENTKTSMVKADKKSADMIN